MANQHNNQNSDHLERSNREPSTPEKVTRQEKGPSKELQKASRDFHEGINTVENGLENSEGIENNEISEDVQEDKKKGPTGALRKGTAAAIQKKPIVQFKLPKVDIMRKQIAHEVERQIRVLEHQAKKMSSSPGNFSPFMFNGVISKIRELKFLLANLASMTFETLKGWWMKFVKNISI